MPDNDPDPPPRVPYPLVLAAWAVALAAYLAISPHILAWATPLIEQIGGP